MSANSPLAGARLRFADLPSTAVWGPLWAAIASLAWLLPNHYRPWLSFHNDAWAAWAFAAGGGLLLLGSRSPLPLHRLSLLAGALVAVPGLQWAWGLLPAPGLAWIATLYLLGFVLTLVVGARAEQDHPEMAVSALLLAISAAAVASVGLQLHQWLSSHLSLWILPVQEMRFYGNLAQANQMATLQIWGLLGVGWFLQRRQFSPPFALLLALLLLLGIALTQSRTAILALGVLVAMAIIWRRIWTAPRQIVALAGGLATWFATCLMAIKPVSEALLLSAPHGSLGRSLGSDTRWDAYRMFLDAVLEKPWLGYGWATVAPAHLAVAERHPQRSVVFEHSHNLFLDLVLWLGLPLGLLVSVALVLWLARQLRCVAAPKEAILVMFVVVVGLHAMLEMPLQYAYMLLPAALVMGALQVRSQARVVILVSRRWVIGLWLGAALLLGAVTRDYFLIEADLEALRFEKIYNIKPPAQPSMLVLSHLSDFIRLDRSRPKPGMTAEEIESARIGAHWFSSPSNLYHYTAALALNGRVEEARQMMRKSVRVVGDGTYQTMANLWESQTSAIKFLPVDVPSWLPLTAASSPQPQH